MAIQKIHLRKLLQLFDAPSNLRTSLLRADIRNSLKNARDDSEDGGGDFHVPFWADCKKHIAKTGNLRELSDDRIAKSKWRARLYPELTEGFLNWWEGSRINEPYQTLENPPKGRLPFPTIDCEIKVENLSGIVLSQNEVRLIYPYFSEEPELTSRSARLGLWALTQALTEQAPDSLRILDVMRSRSFSVADVPFQGDEERIFLQNYEKILREWEELRRDY